MTSSDAQRLTFPDIALNAL